MSYVLVHVYGDHSGIRNVFGPYETESVAEAARNDLERIQVGDLLESFELLPFVPFDKAEA